MPISEREFEAGRTGPEFAAIEILREARGRAFTALEILDHLKGSGHVITLSELERLLDEFVDAGAVRANVVRVNQAEIRYYMYGRSIGFRSGGR